MDFKDFNKAFPIKINLTSPNYVWVQKLDCKNVTFQSQVLQNKACIKNCPRDCKIIVQKSKSSERIIQHSKKNGPKIIEMLDIGFNTPRVLQHGLTASHGS